MYSRYLSFLNTSYLQHDYDHHRHRYPDSSMIHDREVIPERWCNRETWSKYDQQVHLIEQGDNWVTRDLTNIIHNQVLKPSLTSFPGPVSNT